MAREEPTYRMRPEQRDELLKLTAPSSRRTSEMSQVELLDLLKLDLDLAAAPVEIGDGTDLTDRFDMRTVVADETARVVIPPSTLRLVLAFFAALLLGITITIPLW
ncbi:MAG TPA: hypothetical protein VN253_06130 [Kofleriaceae bacterium]|nr:hypothetical protein [Kofleriaceae bacterium]